MDQPSDWSEGPWIRHAPNRVLALERFPETDAGRYLDKVGASG